MEIRIIIKEEIAKDFKNDAFNDFFSRVITDMVGFNGLCGRYELEIAQELQRAFIIAKPESESE